MYRKLLPHVKKFVFVRQGAFNRYYEGKLIAVDAETLQLQSYKKDGTEEEIWTIAMDTITEFSLGGRQLAELELKVSYLASDDMSAVAEAPAVELLEGPSRSEATGSESQVDEI